ncbi:MAG: ankyrin repeat domain-containing protein [Gammaproteobacteria bacterium]|nr:ankyrin repeat domain-containing protein [Gammaproteobacteria bacterium]
MNATHTNSNNRLEASVRPRLAAVRRLVPTLVLGAVMLPGAALARGDTSLNVPENWFAPITVEMIQQELDNRVDINELTLRQQSSAVVRAGNAMAGEDVWQFLIDRGARMNENQLEDRPAIFWVSKGGTPEAVRLVLAQPGVDVHAVDVVDRNSFAHAVRLQPDLAVYRELIAAGIDINKVDRNGRTAMHEAAMRTRYVHLFEFFADLGLRYDALDNNGWDTFLNAAWRNPVFDVVVHLAEHSDIERVGNNGLNAAMLAAENNPSGKVFQWLLDQGLPVDGTDEAGATALIRAGRNSAEVAKILLDMGQDVNATDNNGNTAFINAGLAQELAPELFRVLAQAGADVQAVNNNGANALMNALRTWAVYKKGPQNIRLLIEDYGLRPTRRLENGATPLTIAASVNHSAEVLRLLVDAGARVNDTDGDGWTPLMHYAARTNNTGAIDYLIAAGADVTLRNPDGDTAADLLERNPNLTIVRMRAALAPSGS